MSIVIIILFTFLLTLADQSLARPEASRSTGFTSRISNGTAVNPPHKYPFIVQLWWSGYIANQTEPVADARHGCAASIINKHWIMSAAHCFSDTRSNFAPARTVIFTVLTGTHRSGKLEPWSQNITIIDYIAPSILYKRKGFFQRFHTQDIVLARLATPIIFSDKVTPVNLPPVDFEVVEDFKDTATLIGWGDIREGPSSNGTGRRAEELQEGSLPLITTETCQRRAGLFQYNTRGGETFPESFDVSEFILCAGLPELLPEVPVGDCLGDSGGPNLLYNPKYDTYFQVSIVSTGHCWHDVPQVDTNVGKYVHWIKWNTQRCQWRNVSRSYPVDD